MLIVDAYNVLNAEGVLPGHLAAPDLVELVALIDSSRYARERVVLVCDGHLSRQVGPELSARAAGRAAAAVRFNGADLIFSGAGDEADDVIERLLAHHSGSSRVLLISSDRRLQRAARRSGARYRGAPSFLSHLAADAALPRRSPFPEFAKRTPLSRGETAHWMQVFGLGEPDFTERTVVTAPPVRPPPARARTDPAPAQEAQTPPPGDPELLRLVEKSGVRIDLAELDMQRWVSGVEPFRPFSREGASWGFVGARARRGRRTGGRGVSRSWRSTRARRCTASLGR